jgi:hypothetical protein
MVEKLMKESDRYQSELPDTGDAWLAFVGIFVVGTVVLTAVFWQYISFYWALAGAVPIAIAGGWAVSLIRPVRRVISEIVQFVLG